MTTPAETARALARRAGREQRQRDALVARIRARLPEIAELLRAVGARRVILFGSLAWGGFGASSDVDLAVEGLDARQALDAADAVEAVVGRPVEVFRLESLPASFRERIEREGEAL